MWLWGKGPPAWPVAHLCPWPGSWGRCTRALLYLGSVSAVSSPPITICQNVGKFVKEKVKRQTSQLTESVRAALALGHYKFLP